MHHTIAEYAQVLAARLWFRPKSLKTIAKDWGTSEDFVLFIQSTKEYRSAVEKLMRTTRSPRNILKWRKSWGDDLPKLAERMGLLETVISEMVDRVTTWARLEIES